MDILVIGGTRFFGIPMINSMIQDGHNITIATRGLTRDSYGNSVKRIVVDIDDYGSMKKLRNNYYDVVIDKIGYSSIEMRNILENVNCNRFLHMSTAGVYTLDHMNIGEEEFSGNNIELKWVARRELSYDDVKRQAECALCKVYNDKKWISVRYPFVLGENDYTTRFEFYIRHIVEHKPMYINNMNEQFCVINESEAGVFFNYLLNTDFEGPINGCSDGLVSVKNIIESTEKKIGKKAIILDSGDVAPYNNTMSNSLSTEKARDIGFKFTNVSEWFDALIDFYIDKCMKG